MTSIKASDGEATSRIIQRSPYVVIDEAHKLLEASQATFGEQFSEGMIQKYINSVRYLKSERVKEDAYNYFLDKAKKTNQQLFAMLRKLIPDDEFNDERTFGITIPDSGVSLILRLAETIAMIEAGRKPHRGAYEMDGKGSSRCWSSLCGKTTATSGSNWRTATAFPCAVARGTWQM